MLRPAIREVNEQAGWNYSITMIEPLQSTVYYDNNNHYNWHVDTFAHDSSFYKDDNPDDFRAITIRKVSCSILLSDPSKYEGGELELMSVDVMPNRDISIDLKKNGYFNTQTHPLLDFKLKGSAVFFPSFTFHRVKPVTKGTRKSLVCWFRGPKWQ